MSEIEAAYFPETPLCKLIYAGDYEATVRHVVGLKVVEREGQRDQVKCMPALLSEISIEQWHAMCAAIFLSTIANDSVSWWSGRISQRLEPLLGTFLPELENEVRLELGVATALMLILAWDYSATLECVKNLNADERYKLRSVTRRMAMSSNVLDGHQKRALDVAIFLCHVTVDTIDFWVGRIEKDDHFLYGPLHRLFYIDNSEQAGKIAIGSGELNELSEVSLVNFSEKLYSRQQLLGNYINILMGDSERRYSIWFCRFHKSLTPSVDEMTPFAMQYIELCQGGESVIVSLALTALIKLFMCERVEAIALLPLLPQILSSPLKGQVELALKLLDLIVKGNPGFAHEASALAVVALTHEASTVQREVIERLAKWGMDLATMESARKLLPQISSAYGDTLAALLGGRMWSSAATALSANPDLPIYRSPLSPLDASREIRAIENIDELVERTAYVLENGTDIDEFERVLDGLLRMAPFSPELALRFAPVLKRAHKLKPLDEWRDKDMPVVRELARFLVFIFDGERLQPLLRFSTHSFLRGRIDDLMDLALQGKSVSPLSAPTHKRGFICPDTLVRRVAEHYRCGVKNSLSEQVLSISRLSPGTCNSAKEAARLLPASPYTVALRYALGDIVDIGDERELFSVAGGIRHPIGDDPNLIAAFGNLGKLWVHRFGGTDEQLILFSATTMPSRLEVFFTYGSDALSDNIDWFRTTWQNKVYLTLLLDPTVLMIPKALRVLGYGLSVKESGQCAIAIAIDALIATWNEGRLDVASFGVILQEMLAAPIVKAARLHKSLKTAARAHVLAPNLVFGLLCTLVIPRRDCPPKDIGLLIELLLELTLELKQPVPAATRAAVENMKITGKGKAVQKEFLARTAV